MNRKRREVTCQEPIHRTVERNSASEDDSFIVLAKMTRDESNYASLHIRLRESSRADGILRRGRRAMRVVTIIGWLVQWAPPFDLGIYETMTTWR